ncbi:MAG: hypothetical protein SPL49_07175 [Oribacterium sp.]|nr:hypothetical protein [Oribacterium sp.]MDY6316983.1 hypothetical protein [Oribacterium sp.]
MKISNEVQQLRLQHWAEIIRSCQASGLAVTDWIRENGISKYQYYYWYRKVRTAALESAGQLPQEDQKNSLVEIPVQHPTVINEKTEAPTVQPVSPMPSESKAIFRTDRFSFEISECTSPELLHMILQEVCRAQ